MDIELLLIGKAAEQLGCTTRTIRFYEQRGLIKPARKIGNRRYLDEAALDRMRQILELKGLGFTLREIGTKLKASGNTATPRLTPEEARSQIEYLEKQVASLQEALKHLRAMV